MLQKGTLVFKGKPLNLDWWVPVAYYYRSGVCSLELWVRIVGLSLHLRGKALFKNLGMPTRVFWFWVRTQLVVAICSGLES